MGTQGIKDSLGSWKHFSLNIWWFCLCTGYSNRPTASNTILCHWKYSNKAIYTTASITCGWAGGVTQMWWPFGVNSHCMMDGWTEGWMDGRMNGRTDRPMDQQTYLPVEMQFYISGMFLGLPDNIQKEKPSFFNFENNWLPTDRRTNGRTNRWTDKASYRDAWTHLKCRCGQAGVRRRGAFHQRASSGNLQSDKKMSLRNVY